QTIAVIAAILASSAAGAVEGDPTKGERAFGVCAACHSLEPDRNMTGPSLADLWKRKAGTLASFPRYSPALKLSNVIWDDRTLNKMVKAPGAGGAGHHHGFGGSPWRAAAHRFAGFPQGGAAAGASPSAPGGPAGLSKFPPRINRGQMVTSGKRHEKLTLGGEK